MGAAATAGRIRCEGALERELRARGFSAVAGVDEVGRGSLFGAVVAEVYYAYPFQRPTEGWRWGFQLAPGW